MAAAENKMFNFIKVRFHDPKHTNPECYYIINVPLTNLS
jgi:hypothetical protein